MKIVHVIAGFIASLLVTISTASAQGKLGIFNDFDETSEIVVDNSAWAEFLTSYVRKTEDNRTVVAYGEVSDADHLALKGYIKTLSGIEPTSLSKDEAFVYWVNLYNAITVDIILDSYPLKSIRGIFSGFRPGPWQRPVASIMGVTITLDNIEHGILRKFWSENRVHYAVNCASIGCPNLLDQPFSVKDLEETLDEVARAYVNHPRGIRYEDGKVIASSIYNWFKEDFGGNEAGVIDHLTRYADDDLRAKLKTTKRIDRYEYDWNLNDAK